MPVLEGSKVPGPQTAPEDTAKYCSLFFRPWSLIADTIRVPYLANMAFTRDSRAQALEQKTEIKRRRLTGKQEVRSINWKQTWTEYIREDVVSKHAARIIQTFLVNSLSGSSNIHSAEDDNVDDSDADADIPPSTFTREEAQALLNRDLPTQLTGDKKKTRKSAYADQYGRAMHISSCLWSSGAVRSASARTSSLDADGSWPAANYKQHKLNKS